jgi:hypothetical protein
VKQAQAAAFFGPEINHFVMAITAAEATRSIKAYSYHATDANRVGDMIAEIAPEARESKEALLLAAKAHELLVWP